VIEARGFARKNDDGRNADRRLANRRLLEFTFESVKMGCQQLEARWQVGLVNAGKCPRR
jgi:hypothetical protein